jgi:WD40 repeat protein
MMRILTLGIIFFVLVASICVSQAVEPKLLWGYKADAGMDFADVAVSADGEYVAAGSSGFDDDVAKVYFFNREGELLGSYKISDYCRCGRLSISADGEYIAASAGGGWTTRDEVYFFNRKGKLLWSHAIYHGNGRGISKVVVSADGEYVAVGNIAENWCWPYCGGPSPTIYLFNRAGELLWSYETGHGIYDIAISADGEYIAAGSTRGSNIKGFEPFGELYFFNREGELLWFYKGDISSSVEQISISADGEYIAVGDSNNHYKKPRSKVYFFNREGELLWSYKMGGPVFSLSMSADGEYIAVGDRNKPHSKVYFFNRTGELLWSSELFRCETYVSGIRRWRIHSCWKTEFK